MNPASAPELHDIHLPPPPSWWPPAPGWWIVGMLALALLVCVIVYSYRILQRRRRRLALLAEFERTVAAVHDDQIALAAALSAFLRRLALQREPAAATMAGEAWLAHLDRAVGSDEFSSGVGRILLDAPYRAHADYDAPALIALVRRALWSDSTQARTCLKIVASEDPILDRIGRDAGAQEPEHTFEYVRIPSTAGAQDVERSRF